jgi:phage tail-like protein
MALGARTDPYFTFNFLLEIKGLTVGGFSEVTGLQVEVEVQDYREGGVNEYIHKFSGPVRYPSNLVFKRGLTDAETLWNWLQEILKGNIQRRNISVCLADSAGEEKRRWDIDEAYPIRWVGPEFRAGTAEIAVETLEFVHRGFKLVK